MSNEYVPDLAQLAPGQQAQSSQVNTRYENTVAGFDKLPSPASGKKGFSEPCPVGTPTDTDHAATKEYVDSQLATQVSDAQAAQAASEAAQEASETAAGNAQTSETNAAASESASAASEAAAAAAAALFDFVDLKSGRKNVLINGGMEIWQRGDSFSSVGAQNYTADRWFIAGLAGVDVTKRTLTPPTSFGPLPRLTNYMRCVILALGTGFNLHQRIEGIEKFSGIPLVVSFWAKSTSSSSVAVNFSSGASGSTQVGSFNPTASWERYEIAFTSESYGGAVEYSELKFTPPDELHTFEITGVQLEVGAEATDFEYRSVAEELELCQRYFEKSYNINAAPGSISTESAVRYEATGAGSPRHSVPFNTRKRGTPTITLYSPATGVSGAIRNTSTGTDLAALTVSDIGETRCNIYPSSTPSANHDLTYHFTADAEL